MINSNYKKTVLENGLRVVTEEVPHVRSIALGVWIGAGSRFESEENNGISHFIEHLSFKGTEKRSAKDIAESLDSVGGMLNAFTSKEYTCYYARILDEHFDLALDVLADMMLNSTFKEENIDKERQVIIEEIKMYEDAPDELIHDLYSQAAWGEHSLGRPILGSEGSLNSIGRQEVCAYKEKLYVPENMVISVAGNIKHEEIVEKINEAFNSLEKTNFKKGFQKPSFHKRKINYFKDTSQLQIVLGTEGLKQTDEKLPQLLILNNVLGGGLSSRLMQKVREERGMAYSIFSYHSGYADSGLFNISAGTRPENYAEVLDVVLAELDDIYSKGITEKELKNAKEQLKGNLFLGLESVSSRMTRIGRSELCLNRIRKPNEVVKSIMAVSHVDISNLARNICKKEEFSLVTLGPVKEE